MEKSWILPLIAILSTLQDCAANENATTINDVALNGTTVTVTPVSEPSTPNNTNPPVSPSSETTEQAITPLQGKSAHFQSNHLSICTSPSKFTNFLGIIGEKASKFQYQQKFKILGQ